MPDCYNFKPIYSNIDNYLKVDVGNNTDVAIKVINAKTDVCIRFVYINSNSSFKITNIPEGIFYLKIAYGKDWYMKNENGKNVSVNLPQVPYIKKAKSSWISMYKKLKLVSVYAIMS